MTPEALDVQDLTRQKIVYTFDRRKVLSQLKLIPNLISLFRLFIIIPIVLLYPDPRFYILTIVLLSLAYISDYLDGLVARKWRMITPLGLVLDPLADKVWTVTMSILLVIHRDFPLWLAGVIILRDLSIAVVNTPIFRRLGMVFPSDILGKLYMVIVGLVILGFTLYIPQSLYLAYALPILAIMTLGRYAYRTVSVFQSMKNNSDEYRQRSSLV